MFERKPLIDRPELLSGDMFSQSGGSCNTRVGFNFQVVGRPRKSSMSTNDVGNFLNSAPEVEREVMEELERVEILGARVGGVSIETGGSFGTVKVQTSGTIDGLALDDAQSLVFDTVSDSLTPEFGSKVRLTQRAEADIPAIEVQSTTRNL